MGGGGGGGKDNAPLPTAKVRGQFPRSPRASYATAIRTLQNLIIFWTYKYTLHDVVLTPHGLRWWVEGGRSQSPPTRFFAPRN